MISELDKGYFGEIAFSLNHTLNQQRHLVLSIFLLSRSQSHRESLALFEKLSRMGNF
jgi:hypothetical protein